jgi:hypothetical protein
MFVDAMGGFSGHTIRKFGGLNAGCAPMIIRLVKRNAQLK